MIFVGESLNASIKTVAAAINERNARFVQDLAREQVNNGANYLDLNAGTGTGDEAMDLQWLVDTVQEVVDIPLMLDSSNPKALKEVLPHCRYTPIVNSISAEAKKLDALLPLVEQEKCSVVALCLDDRGIPNTNEQRYAAAEKLMDLLNFLPPQNIYLDPLVLAVSSNPQAGNVVLKTFEMIKQTWPEVHTVGGMSNVSFGLPVRRLLNRTFMAMAVQRGLDTCIIDVRDQELVSVIYAAEALSGLDRFCSAYVKRYREGKLS